MLSDVEHRATVRQSQGLHPLRDYPGWAHLLNALSEAVEFHEQHSEAAQWQVTLLAEKLGRLRIEASGGDTHTRALEQFVQIVSSHTCQRCGAPGSARKIGVRRATLCDVCYPVERAEERERIVAMTPQEKFAENNLAIVKKLLQTGLDPNERDENGASVLHDGAASNRNPEVIKTLLEAGADPNLADNNGWTPLHCAAASGETPEVITALAEGGADVNRTGNIGETPLQLAVTFNPDVAITHALIDAGAQPNAADAEGRAALHWAAKLNASSATFKALVERGADPNQPDTRGRTPVHWTARWHHDPEAMAILIEAGADAERRDEEGFTSIDYIDVRKNTAETPAKPA